MDTEQHWINTPEQVAQLPLGKLNEATKKNVLAVLFQHMPSASARLLARQHYESVAILKGGKGARIVQLFSPSIPRPVTIVLQKLIDGKVNVELNNRKPDGVEINMHGAERRGKGYSGMHQGVYN